MILLFFRLIDFYQCLFTLNIFFDEVDSQCLFTLNILFDEVDRRLGHGKKIIFLDIVYIFFQKISYR